MKISDSIIREVVKEVVDKFFTRKKSNESQFVERVYSNGLSHYVNRLEKIGFKSCRHVFDAGCGYGQWALALSTLNKEVLACDIDDNRLEFLQQLIELLGIKNIKLELNGVDRKRYPPSYFDAIFCYSVIYKTEWSRSLDNMIHSLEPGGHVYICSNGLGWYIYNIESPHKAAPDFNPRQHAIGSIEKTLNSYSGASEDAQLDYDYIIPSHRIVECLKSNCSILYAGIEGGANIKQSKTEKQAQSFFIGEFRGVEAVYEIVARKDVADE